MLGQDLGSGGEVKAENAQGRCREVGRDLVQVGSEFGARRQPVSQAGNKKVVVTKRAKQERVTRTKKNDKNQKNTLTKKKFFFLGGQNWLRPLGLPIRHQALPFGPHVRLDSGFPYHLRPTFDSYRKVVKNSVGKTNLKTGTTVLPW